MKKLIILLLAFCIVSLIQAQKTIYCDIHQTIEARVNDLLSRMTLEEKAGQLAMPILEGTGETIFSQIEQGRVGSLCVTRRDTLSISYRNRLQRSAIEHSRLHIPLLFGFDVIHGYHTLFPIPLAISTSWNEDLAQEAAQISALEAHQAGMNMTFSPMVDVARDSRWGRISEGSGEDALINSRFGQAFIKGYQGNSFTAPGSIAACLKHFVGYGASIGGRDYQYTELSDRALCEVYLPPFKAGIEAGALGIMSSFNDISGTPATAHEGLLRGVLKQEWGFQGLVVSDWDAVVELREHGIADSKQDLAQTALNAGVDIEMKSDCYQTLPEQVRRGAISVNVIDEAVKRVLTVKFRLGLFEQPYINEHLIFDIKEQTKHREVARRLATESMVLVKNEGVLPLVGKEIKKIGLYGNWADNTDVCGWWNGMVNYKEVVTMFAGLKKQLGKGQQLLLEDDQSNQKPDIAIVCVGEKSSWFGENHSRSNIELPDGQLDKIKELKANHVPVVAVVFCGRPLVLTELEKYADAILIAWHPGSETGNAVTDLLVGKVNPSGKLTTTFPKSTGQVPIYYAQRRSGRPMHDGYIDIGNKPLYPFGYGLSYTTFTCSQVMLSDSILHKKGAVTVSLNVTNTGSRTGKEVIQLYVHDRISSVTQPDKRLIDFRKVELKAGEMKQVCFILSAQQLKLWNKNLKEVFEDGEFDIFVGNSLDNLSQQVLKLTD